MGVGGDEIWYNAGENRIYFGASAEAIGVVDAETNQVVGTIPVNGRNVSVDSETGRVFVPVAGKGVLVFAAPCAQHLPSRSERALLDPWGPLHDILV